MTPQRATQAGLDYTARPSLFLCGADKWVTQTSAGQEYQEVVITVSGAEYIPVGPQARFGQGMGIDDSDHVEVPVVRRPT